METTIFGCYVSFRSIIIILKMSVIVHAGRKGKLRMISVMRSLFSCSNHLSITLAAPQTGVTNSICAYKIKDQPPTTTKQKPLKWRISGKFNNSQPKKKSLNFLDTMTCLSTLPFCSGLFRRGFVGINMILGNLAYNS